MGMSATVLLLVINYDTTRRTDKRRLPSLPTLPAPGSPVTWTRSLLYKLSLSLRVIHPQRLPGMWLTNNDVISVSIHFRTLANHYRQSLSIYIYTCTYIYIYSYTDVHNNYTHNEYVHMTIIPADDYKWYEVERA